MASRLYVSNIPSGTDKSELHAFLRGTTTYKSEPIERILYPLNEDDTRACICFYDVPSIKKFDDRNKTFKEKVLVFTESPDIVSSWQVCLSPKFHDFIRKDASLTKIISCHIKESIEKRVVLHFDSLAKMNDCVVKLERSIIENLEDEATKSANQESNERKIYISDDDVVEYLFKFKNKELKKISDKFEVTIERTEKYIIIRSKKTRPSLDHAENAVIDVYQKLSSMSATENVDLSDWLVPISKQHGGFKESLKLGETYLESMDLMLKKTKQKYIYSIVGDGSKITEGKTKLIEVLQEGLGDVADGTRLLVASNNEPLTDEPHPKKSVRILLHQQGQLEYTTENPKINIRIYQGNIINEKTSVIVNAANEELIHGGGLAEAIAMAAGDKLVKDCNRIVKEDGPLKVGNAVLSHAGKLNCSKVMHAVGPRKDDCQSNEECFQKLNATFLNCLLLADTRHVKSIAIPAISSGIFGVPMDIVCKALYQSIIKFCNSRSTSALEEIHLVNIDEKTSTEICCYFALKLGITSSFFTKTIDDFRCSVCKNQLLDAKINAKRDQISCYLCKRCKQSNKKYSTVTEGVQRENCVNCDEPSTGHVYTCGHQMCHDCIDRHSHIADTDRCCRCSNNQPSTGKMIACQDEGYLKLGFLFENGIQTGIHPRPDEPYNGICKEIYLSSEDPRSVRFTKMLATAFNKKLIFSVCFNKITQQYHVTWSGLIPNSISNSGSNQTDIPNIHGDQVEKSEEFFTRSFPLDVTESDSFAKIPYMESKEYHDSIAKHFLTLCNLVESRI